LQNRPPSINPDLLLPGLSDAINSGLQAVDGNDPLSYTISQVNSSVDEFGYNSGYFRTILDNPPSGVRPNPEWEFTYNPSNALEARMTTPLLESAIKIYELWFILLNNLPKFSQQKQTYVGIQATAYTRGVITWTTRLTVQGFSSDDYNLLLEASSGFLELARLNALSLTQCVGFKSEFLAKNAALMNVNFAAFIRGYSVGLLNGINDNVQPLPFPHIEQ